MKKALIFFGILIGALVSVLTLNVKAFGYDALNVPINKLNGYTYTEFFENYNLAMPDLDGKEYLGDGVYRLSTQHGLTWDYNVYTTQFVLNGIATQRGAVTLKTFTDPTTYTLSFQYISGSIDATGTGLVVYMSPPHIAETQVYVNGRTNIGESKTYTHTNPYFDLRLGTWWAGDTFDNYTFTIQLEKGDKATMYIPPSINGGYLDIDKSGIPDDVIRQSYNYYMTLKDVEIYRPKEEGLLLGVIMELLYNMAVYLGKTVNTLWGFLGDPLTISLNWLKIPILAPNGIGFTTSLVPLNLLGPGILILFALWIIKALVPIL